MLSKKAQFTLNNYFNLPFDKISNIKTPYFNNLRWKQRGQLKVLSGKGTPEEIVEEAKIISIQYHLGLFDHEGHYCLCKGPICEGAEEKIRKLLIENGLGVDCSGFVTNILNEHFKEKHNIKNLARTFYKGKTNIIRNFINYLRPIENTGVITYADDKNTKKIEKLKNVKPADVIVLLNVTKPVKHNHILLITDVSDKKINYVHARAWSSEGKFGHGVSKGEIELINPEKYLLNQNWIEKEIVNEKNETYQEAKNAERLEIRRIIIKN